MSRLLTWVLRLLPVLGIILALVGLGVFGGLPGSWWDPKGFIVNLVSGFTAACFGVPIAFFVLQRLLQQEDDKRAERSRRQLFTNYLRDIRLNLHELVGGDSNEAVLAKLAFDARALQEYVDTKLMPALQPLAGGSGAHSTISRSELDSAEKLLQDMVFRAKEALQRGGADQEGNLATVHLRWAFVVDQLIPQARMHGIVLMTDVTATRIGRGITHRGPFRAVRELVGRCDDGFTLNGELAPLTSEVVEPDSDLVRLQGTPFGAQHGLSSLSSCLTNVADDIENFIALRSELDDVATTWAEP